jgi:hypothetical protein
MKPYKPEQPGPPLVLHMFIIVRYGKLIIYFQPESDWVIDRISLRLHHPVVKIFGCPNLHITRKLVKVDVEIFSAREGDNLIRESLRGVARGGRHVQAPTGQDSCERQSAFHSNLIEYNTIQYNRIIQEEYHMVLNPNQWGTGEVLKRCQSRGRSCYRMRP